MEKRHLYPVDVEWTGNRGRGTAAYRAYGREHVITAGAKPPIPGSSDPAFAGDAARWNPEDLLVASLSACHKLWYLHMAATAGVIVTAYLDHAEGTMIEEESGAGHFESVTLRPWVTIDRASDAALAASLHHKAHAMCFIAASVNFPVSCEPKVLREGEETPR